MGSINFSKYFSSMLNSTTSYIQNTLTIRGTDFFCGGGYFFLKAVAVFKNKVLKLPDHTVYFTNTTNMQS